MLLKPKVSRNFVRILADGSIRRKVSPDTPGAELRKWKLADGTAGETWETVFEHVEGRIVKVWFSDSQFGPQINTTFTDGEDEVTLTIGLQSRFADDYMKKLPNVDFDHPVAIVPYSFDDDKGKERKGVTFYQHDAKLQNYFFDSENKEVLHGFPEPAGDEKTSDDWKIYFLSVRKFLRKYITSHVAAFLSTAVESDDSDDAGDEPALTNDDGIGF